MGILQNIKDKLFKKEVPIVQPPVEVYADGNPKQVDGKRFINHVCECGCEKLIGEERYSKSQGHYFIKKHYEQKKRLALNGR